MLSQRHIHPGRIRRQSGRTIQNKTRSQAPYSLNHSEGRTICLRSTKVSVAMSEWEIKVNTAACCKTPWAIVAAQRRLTQVRRGESEESQTRFVSEKGKKKKSCQISRGVGEPSYTAETTSLCSIPLIFQQSLGNF